MSHLLDQKEFHDQLQNRYNSIMDIDYTPALKELSKGMDSLLEKDKIHRSRKKP
jgi:hypothetical protein